MTPDTPGGQNADRSEGPLDHGVERVPPEKNVGNLALAQLFAERLTGVFVLARYAYLLRVPIIVAAILFVFPFAALLPSSALSPLFQNLFLMDGGGVMWPWPTFWSTMAALVVSWSVLLSSRIILLNCEDRLNVPSQMKAANLRGWPFFGILVLAVPIILGQFTQQRDFRPGQTICIQCAVAVISSAVFAYILAFAALWFAVVLAPPHTQGSALTFPCFAFMKNWLRWADDHHVLPKPFRPGIWIRESLPQDLWQGYLAFDGFPWSGHWLALLFGLATLGLYWFVDWTHGRSVGQLSGVTALTFVLLLLLNANWVLSLAAFFLDRFRIPVLLPVALFALISGNVRRSDHFFQVQGQPKAITSPSPGEVLKARASKPIVAIATAGGGIQAAAWTAQVLAGLQQQYQQWFPGKSLAENITLISSVSGGATGSMFYVNLYDRSALDHFRTNELTSLTDLVSRSSLDDVAWALVYHDLPRIFFPSRNKFYDRGYILEENWRVRAQIDQTLSEWRDGVKEGWRPAVIFNSTITETGEPLTFSTTAWRQERDPQTKREVAPRRRDFYDMYDSKDVRVVTAVRLAASFPYVSPAARPDTQSSDDYHMIDGGYYDNYGVANLIAWLEQGLSDLQPPCKENAAGIELNPTLVLPRILVLEIRSFPPDEEARPTKKGWAFQLYAPVKGLLSVRSTAQLVRDREALTMFARRWEKEAAETAQAKIQFATFEFGGCGPTEEEGSKNAKGKEARDKATNPPLSWAMNPSQLQAVKDDWNARVNREYPCKSDPNIDKVHCFLDPSFSGCAALSHKPE